ncbi:unnamed protein product [Trichogramma brassicae]|uniref:RNase H type-1 domain-containing protein n=1 Tax=Trichogramma brassicae TaxID=86971 RepID=A0A6H5IC94_9HYME|nr:unnamed protein product [Trichogramma brassicae]
MQEPLKKELVQGINDFKIEISEFDKNFSAKGPMIEGISAKEASERNCSVRFTWMPSHIGSRGSEAVDALARVYTCSDSADHHRVIFSDLVELFRRECRASSTSKWARSALASIVSRDVSLIGRVNMAAARAIYATMASARVPARRGTRTLIPAMFSVFCRGRSALMLFALSVWAELRVALPSPFTCNLMEKQDAS